MPGRVVLAFFARRADALAALSALASRGVPPAAVSCIVATTSDLGVAPASKAPEGAAVGAIVGLATGALAGGLGGSGSAVLPAFDLVLAGSVVTALATAGVLATIGVLAGALVGALRPEYEARWMRDAVASGGSLLAVRCEGLDPDHVGEVLERCGGVGIASVR